MLHWIKSLFYEHEWEPYGSGYDSMVKCKKCGKIRDEEPGDLAPW